MLLHVFKAYNL